MTPRTDVCEKCELHCREVMAAVSEEAKSAAVNKFSAHLHYAQRERDYYQRCTVEAVEESRAGPVEVPPRLPCSTNYEHSHYTFDFAQLLQLPHFARQVGPIYF